VIGLPLAGFALWQLGPTGAAPLTAPYLIYSVFVVFLLPAPRRQTLQCALCEHRAYEGRLCGRHFNELARLLDPANTGSRFDPLRPTDPRTLPSIPALYSWLDASPVRRDIGSQVTAASFGSKPPGDLHIMSLRDPRSRPDGVGPDDHEPAPPLAVATVLTEIVARVDRTDIDGNLEDRPERTVQNMCAWLYARRDWLAAQSWIPDAYQALRALLNQLRGAWGDPAMRPVGTCRQLVDDDGRLQPDGKWRCAWPLYLPEQPPRAMDEPVQLPTLRCASCGWTYHGAELVQLGRDREQALKAQEAS
jgi:hypothetical protein